MFKNLAMMQTQSCSLDGSCDTSNFCDSAWRFARVCTHVQPYYHPPIHQESNAYRSPFLATYAELLHPIFVGQVCMRQLILSCSCINNCN